MNVYSNEKERGTFKFSNLIFLYVILSQLFLNKMLWFQFQQPKYLLECVNQVLLIFFPSESSLFFIHVVIQQLSTETIMCEQLVPAAEKGI